MSPLRTRGSTPAWRAILSGFPITLRGWWCCQVLASAHAAPVLLGCWLRTCQSCQGMQGGPLWLTAAHPVKLTPALCLVWAHINLSPSWSCKGLPFILQLGPHSPDLRLWHFLCAWVSVWVLLALLGFSPGSGPADLQMFLTILLYYPGKLGALGLPSLSIPGHFPPPLVPVSSWWEARKGWMRPPNLCLYS